MLICLLCGLLCYHVPVFTVSGQFPLRFLCLRIEEIFLSSRRIVTPLPFCILWNVGMRCDCLLWQGAIPLCCVCSCRSLQATLSLELGLFQFKPRMSPHQREGEDTWDRYTVTDMCVDLACCLDTLEQDTTCHTKMW